MRLKKKRNKRTGGPQTELGKAIASKNSETHGAFALKRPDTDDYYAFAERVQRELRPTGPLQHEVVDSAAFDSYKSIKLREIERRNLLRAEQEPVSAKKLAELTGYPWSDTHLQMLAEPINPKILQRFIHKSWKLLAKPKVLADNAEAQSMPDRMVTEMYEEGCRLLSAAGLCQFNEEAFFAKLDVVMLEARVQKNYLGKRIQESGAEVLLVQYWLYRNAVRVSQAIHQLQDDKVVDVLSEEGMVRAKAHVSNSLRNNISNLESLKAGLYKGNVCACQGDGAARLQAQRAALRHEPRELCSGTHADITVLTRHVDTGGPRDVAACRGEAGPEPTGQGHVPLERGRGL